MEAASNYTQFTPKKKEDFFKALRRVHNVSAAARKVGISRLTAYNHRKKDPEFAAEWDDITEAMSDSLEQEAIRRAKDGCLKPIYQGGAKVGSVREYSDTLMIFLLKGNRPEKYKERRELSGSTTVTQLPAVDFSKLSLEEAKELARIFAKCSPSETPGPNP